MVLLASTILVGCGSTTSAKNTETKKSTEKVEQKSSNIRVGEYAPDFKLQNLNGETVSLSSLAGKKVYLKFWASWCGPCKESIPELLKLMDNQDRDLMVKSLKTIL